MEAFAFLFGLLACYGYLSIAASSMLALSFLLEWRRLLFAFFLGCVYALLHVYCCAPQGLPKEEFLSKVRVQGVIVSIVQRKAHSQQFTLRIKRLNHRTVDMTAQLRCYNGCIALKSGQSIEAHAKLKRPRNRGNPNAFNFVASMQAKHIDWVGYMYPKTLQILSDDPYTSYISRLRTRLSAKLDALPLTASSNALLTALSLGDGQKISDEHWSLFRQTGIAHLMVISGAHISLVSGLIFFLMTGMVRAIPRVPLWIPAQKIAAIAAILSGLGYVFLAGSAVPAQRAWIGCALFFMRYLSSRPFTGWLAWRYALMGVLLVEPHAVITMGFYLSFAAVGTLLYANQRFHATGIKKILIMQSCCLIGLMPLTLYCFGYGAFSGFFANILAIPFVGFLMVPLALLMLIVQGSLLTYMSEWANHLTTILVRYLHLVDHLSFINMRGTFSCIAFPLVSLVSLFALTSLPKKYLVLPFSLALAATLNFSGTIIANGAAQMDVIDVGQGLAVLIRTEKHQMLYDTGGKYYKGPDMGSIAILPYLAYVGVKTLDALVISHPDLDHRGGLASIESRLAIRSFIVDDPSYYHRGLNCHHQKPWVWDGVHFEFLALRVPMKSKNNHSCVLRVYNKRGQWLLTGDIERESEQWLIDHYKKKIPSTVMLVPHHGSQTSSSDAFLQAVKPNVAIISSGYANRFHFPHALVLSRYRARGIAIKNTSSDGLVTERL